MTTKFEQMVDKNDEILNILSSSHNKKAGLSTLLLLTVTTSTVAVGSRVGLSVGSAWQPIRTKINRDDDKHDGRRFSISLPNDIINPVNTHSDNFEDGWFQSWLESRFRLNNNDFRIK